MCRTAHRCTLGRVAEVIYKIATRAEWFSAEHEGVYMGSAHDVRDGFIHFSRAHQLAATADKHFHGQRELLLVAVDSAAVGGALRYEVSRGGDAFPHLYGPLWLQHVLWVHPLMTDAAGWVWPHALESAPGFEPDVRSPAR